MTTPVPVPDLRSAVIVELLDQPVDRLEALGSPPDGK